MTRRLKFTADDYRRWFQHNWCRVQNVRVGNNSSSYSYSDYTKYRYILLLSNERLFYGVLRFIFEVSDFLKSYNSTIEWYKI